MVYSFSYHVEIVSSFIALPNFAGAGFTILLLNRALLKIRLHPAFSKEPIMVATVRCSLVVSGKEVRQPCERQSS